MTCVHATFASGLAPQRGLVGIVEAAEARVLRERLQGVNTAEICRDKGEIQHRCSGPLKKTHKKTARHCWMAECPVASKSQRRVSRVFRGHACDIGHQMLC